MLTCDNYSLPTSLAEALNMWSRSPKGSLIVSGATDILPAARDGREGDIHVPELVDVTRIEELNGYKIDGKRIRLGANVVYQDFLTDKTLMECLPCMPYCAVWFADDQIRQQASLTGNIINASPAADGTPAAIVSNGSIELARLGENGISRRKVKVIDFIEGPGKTQIADDEVATAMILDVTDNYGGSFQKVGKRRSLVISVACCAALVSLNSDERKFKDVRIAVGGVGPRPTRLFKIENALIGQPLSSKIILKASEEAAQTVASRSRIEYRKEVVVNFVRAAIEEAVANASAKFSNSERKREILSV